MPSVSCGSGSSVPYRICCPNKIGWQRTHHDSLAKSNDTFRSHRRISHAKSHNLSSSSSIRFEQHTSVGSISYLQAGGGGVLYAAASDGNIHVRFHQTTVTGNVVTASRVR